MRIAVISITIAFCLSIGIANAQNISDEARRHFDRGQAAVEMAKSSADYEDAIKEFEQAATLAPDWPNVYYNLGLIQEKVGKYDDALRNLTKYLELSPNASDIRGVKKFIAKIEYKIEKTKAEHDKIKDFLGTWDVFSSLGDASWEKPAGMVFTSNKGALMCNTFTTAGVVSTQVDGKKLKIEKYRSDARHLSTENECHYELITTTLMRGYCNSKTIWVADPDNAHLIGRTLRYTMELRKN